MPAGVTIVLEPPLVVVVVLGPPLVPATVSVRVTALPLRSPFTSACALASEPANGVNSVVNRVDSWLVAVVLTVASFNLIAFDLRRRPTAADPA